MRVVRRVVLKREVVTGEPDDAKVSRPVRWGPTEKGSQDHLAGGLPNYAGSGPAQLALALAADVLGDDEAALDVYQRLKFRVVSRLAADGWALTEVELAEAIRGLRGADGE